MNFLPLSSLRRVEEYDAEHHRAAGGFNYNRFYNVLQAVGNDIEIHTVACKARRDGSMAVKEVVRASVDDLWIYFKDVAYCGMAGYQVDWSKEKAGYRRQWNFNDRWESTAWDRRCCFKLRARVINPELLLESSRFKYCAWTESCGHLLDYLKAYESHPRIELLSKADCGYFAARIGFVRSLERNKDFMRFFMTNLAEIKARDYGCDVIQMAFRNKVTFEAAQNRLRATREFRGFLPAGVDPEKAGAYVASHNTYRSEYGRYLANCVTLGMDLGDTKVAFPRNFRRQDKVVSDRVAELEAQRDAEEARKLDRQIAAVAKRFKRLELGATRAFRVELPRKSAEFQKVGRLMHNCLGAGYSIRMAKGEAIVAFVRRVGVSKGAPAAAVEYDPRQRKILQCYAAKNGKPPAQVLAFVNRVFKPRKKAA
jgi:hypothetical protein